MRKPIVGKNDHGKEGSAQLGLLLFNYQNLNFELEDKECFVSFALHEEKNSLFEDVPF